MAPLNCEVPSPERMSTTFPSAAFVRGWRWNCEPSESCVIFAEENDGENNRFLNNGSAEAVSATSAVPHSPYRKYRGEGVAEAVRLAVALRDNEAVGVAVEVCVAVSEAVGVPAGEPDAVLETVDVADDVVPPVREEVGEAVTEPVLDGEPVDEDVGLAEAVRLAVAVAEDEGVSLGVAVRLRVAVRDAVRVGEADGVGAAKRASNGDTSTDRHLLLGMVLYAMGRCHPSPVVVEYFQSAPSAVPAAPVLETTKRKNSAVSASRPNSYRPVALWMRLVVLNRTEGTAAGAHGAVASARTKLCTWRVATAPASTSHRELFPSNTKLPSVAVSRVCTAGTSNPGKRVVACPVVVGRPAPTKCGPRFPASPKTITN